MSLGSHLDSRVARLIQGPPSFEDLSLPRSTTSTETEQIMFSGYVYEALADTNARNRQN